MCLSRHPEVRLNNGLLKVVEREQRADDLWKLVYESPFHEKSWKQMVLEWMDEAKRYERIQAERAEAA